MARGNKRSTDTRSLRTLKRRWLKSHTSGRLHYGTRRRRSSASITWRRSGLERSRVLQALVTERTRQLTEVNERLKSSVIRCQHLDGRLRESEELFRSIFEHAAAGMNTVTLDGRYLQVNPAFCEFIGYSSEELRHLTLFDLTHPEDLPATRKRFNGICAGCYEAFDYEKRFVRKDGRLVWGHVTSAWMFDERRQPLYGIGLVQDISDRKAAEAGLKKALASARDAQARITCILESVADGLIVTDVHQRIVLMNPSAESLLRISSAQVLNRSVVDPAIASLLPAPLVEFLNCGEGGALFEFEGHAGTSKGPQALQARMSVIQDQSQRHGGMITTLRDVSREREIDAMKTDFITTAAHELRTPLTSIQGYSEVLLTRSDLENAQRHSMLTIIHEQSESLGRIVKDLLDLARIETGNGFVLQKSPCDLSQLIQEALLQVSRMSERHQFERALQAEPLTVFGDRLKLLQVLENVLSNAIKYSPLGGTVRVAATGQTDHVLVSIADQGIGMSGDQLRRIFDKFYRADTSNSAIEGVGLGMNIVQEIIKAHGGEIRVESCLGEGTVVHFTLPAE